MTLMCAIKLMLMCAIKLMLQRTARATFPHSQRELSRDVRSLRVRRSLRECESRGMFLL